jgi:CBS domain containing-hemolysin-like protein
MITAGEIMTPRTEVQGIQTTASLPEVSAAILKDGHSRIPVYDETIDNIVGILFAKDLIPFVSSDKPFDLRAVLREPLLVPKTKSVRELLSEFKARKVHMAIVLDEYGGTAGLVTVEDIIEELVGEIQDEHEHTAPAEPRIRWLDGRTAEVDARVDIDDLGDELGMPVPEDADYETVGGFVFSTLGHIPDVGEHFEVANLRFTVTGAQRNRVNRVRVERLAATTSAEPQEAAPEA